MMDASKRPKGCNRKLKDCEDGFGHWLWKDGSIYNKAMWKDGSIYNKNLVKWDLRVCRCGADNDNISVRLCRDCLIKEGYLW